MPIKHTDPNDNLVKVSIRQGLLLEMGQAGFTTLEDYIKHLKNIIIKKTSQYEAITNQSDKIEVSEVERNGGINAK